MIAHEALIIRLHIYTKHERFYIFTIVEKVREKHCENKWSDWIYGQMPHNKNTRLCMYFSINVYEGVSKLCCIAAAVTLILSLNYRPR